MKGHGDSSSSDEEVSVCSGDEALYEVLGLSAVNMAEDESCKKPTRSLAEDLDALPINTSYLPEKYESHGYCILPQKIAARHLRRLTDQLVYQQTKYPADYTYETISGERKLTRLENFCDSHWEWKMVADCIGKILSVMLDDHWTLFKEKLNLKPPGGKGFAPHLDGPSLQVALKDGGPTDFCTVMLAIDDMTQQNGCLQICPGLWSAQGHVKVLEPSDENPDAGGRAGAIAEEELDRLRWYNLECRAGSLVAFHGWVPHRSGFNRAAFSRRAVFFTYNTGGDFHSAYYQSMRDIRNSWREKVGLEPHLGTDEQRELQALATVPK